MPDRTTPSAPIKLAASPRERFLVVHAPGWPGGYEPHPNTLENARRFVAEHGGTLRRRLQSDWEDVPDA